MITVQICGPDHETLCAASFKEAEVEKAHAWMTSTTQELVDESMLDEYLDDTPTHVFWINTWEHNGQQQHAVFPYTANPATGAIQFVGGSIQ